MKIGYSKCDLVFALTIKLILCKAFELKKQQQRNKKNKTKQNKTKATPPTTTTTTTTKKKTTRNNREVFGRNIKKNDYKRKHDGGKMCYLFTRRNITLNSLTDEQNQFP